VPPALRSAARSVRKCPQDVSIHENATALGAADFPRECAGVSTFSADGSTWQVRVVGTPISVGLGGQVDLSWRLQAWIGATIGLFAVKTRAP
jgi:hypothetical protein